MSHSQGDVCIIEWNSYSNSDTKTQKAMCNNIKCNGKFLINKVKVKVKTAWNWINELHSYPCVKNQIRQ